MSSDRCCIECKVGLPPSSHFHKKYCSGKCKARFRKKTNAGKLEDGHDCRMCGKHFDLVQGQGNKWLCSPECRIASNAKGAREFYLRRPQMAEIYRARTKAKHHPDSANVRFYRLNPDAPKSCQSCGENRVTEVAHKPGHERLGERRSSKNLKWPEQVWVLCPTCHRLIDRMHYSPEELGLSV